MNDTYFLKMLVVLLVTKLGGEVEFSQDEIDSLPMGPNELAIELDIENRSIKVTHSTDSQPEFNNEDQY